MVTKIIEKEFETSHPMEEVFDLPENSTIATTVERTTDMVNTEVYDTKDDEIDEQFQEIFDSAMTAYDVQMGEGEVVEGKYKARNGEVAVQFLNTALNAAKEKSSVKQHKDKLQVAKGNVKGSGTTNNNLIVADRNDILKALAGKT